MLTTGIVTGCDTPPGTVIVAMLVADPGFESVAEARQAMALQSRGPSRDSRVRS
jgi:hypothetical protein